MSLRAARERAALTQAELAHFARLSPQTVQRAETGQTVPHPRTRRRLAIALGLAVGDLTWN